MKKQERKPDRKAERSEHVCVPTCVGGSMKWKVGDAKVCVPACVGAVSYTHLTLPTNAEV